MVYPGKLGFMRVCGILQGRLNKQIAFALGVSERTVKAQRAQAMDKLGVVSAAELGALAERLRQLPDSQDQP